MNITSNNTMIFAKEYNGKMFYRAGLSRKKDDKTYENGYIDVKLPKDVELADKTKINITKGFLSFYKSKDKKDIFYIVVQEFTTESGVKEEPKEEDVYSNFGNSITVEQLDEQMELPF